MGLTQSDSQAREQQVGEWAGFVRGLAAQRAAKLFKHHHAMFLKNAHQNNRTFIFTPVQLYNKAHDEILLCLRAVHYWRITWLP